MNDKLAARDFGHRLRLGDCHLGSGGRRDYGGQAGRPVRFVANFEGAQDGGVRGERLFPRKLEGANPLAP